MTTLPSLQAAMGLPRHLCFLNSSRTANCRSFSIFSAPLIRSNLGGCFVILLIVISLSRQPSQRLPVCKFNQVPIRIAHHHEISHDPAEISWRLNQNVLLLSECRNPIDFLTRVALKSEVIEPRLHFVLHDDEHEDWIFAGIGFWTQPNVVPSFQSSIANDRKTAE